MKKMFFFCILAALCGILTAQTEDWLWAAQAGSSVNDNGNGIALDSNGNIYVTGSFRETATFGSITLVNAGNADIFIAKLDNEGNWLWAKQAGGSMVDNGWGIVIDNAGNCYVTGQFKQTATFGSTTLVSNNIDAFIAKLDPDGNWLWVKQAGGSTNDTGATGIDLVIDGSNHLLIVGEFWGSVTFGSTTLVSTTSMHADVFVAKLNSNGDWLWTAQGGGIYSDEVGGITVDGNDDYYIAGSFSYSAVFGSTTLAGFGEYDIFAAKLDTDGNWQWATQAGSIGDDYGTGIASDQNGNCFITGSFSYSAGFGSINLNSFGSEDIFVSKLDTDGNWLWAQQAGEAFDERGFDIATDNDGNCYVTGYFAYYAAFGPLWLDSYGQEDIFVCKLDTDGDWLWAAPAGGIMGYEYGKSITVDSAGNSYVTGRFNSTAYFGSNTVISAGNYDVFVAKTGIESSVDPQQLPATQYLSNYPNPFNPETTIEFSIKENEEGILTIFNLKGQKILSETFQTGNHKFTWNAMNQTSGVYLYRLQTPSHNRINKALLLK